LCCTFVRFCPAGDDGTRRETLTRRATLARACNHHGDASNLDACGANGAHLGFNGILQDPPRNVRPSPCERSRPLTHTGSLHVPILALPARQLNEPHCCPVLSSVAHRPATTASPDVRKKIGRGPAQPRATGHGQGLWAAALDRSAGGVSAGGKREKDGGTRRGGQKVGDLVPRLRDNRKERGGSNGTEEAAAGRQMEGGSRKRKPVGGVKVSSWARGGPGGGAAGASISF